MNTKSSECVLLSARGYLPQASEGEWYSKIEVTQYNVTPLQGRIFAGVKFWQTRRNKAIFDSLIGLLTDKEPFIFYTPVCSNDIASLTISKHQCVGYYVTEDGSASYRDFNPQTFTGVNYLLYRFLLKPLYPSFFAIKNHFITTDHPKFRGCIASSNKCFPLHQQYLTVVGSPWKKVSLEVVPDAVLSIDILFRYESDETIERVYARLASIFSERGYRNVFYKFHPIFDSEVCRNEKLKVEGHLKRYFQDVNMIFVSPGECLEDILYSYRADFYTDASSVSIYAAEAGCQIYSYYPLLPHFDLQKQIPFFKDYAIPIS